MISLLSEKWLPVRRSSGSLDWIRPSQIGEPDIVAFAANRADFNGALAQCMIGLLQTAAAVEDEDDWRHFQAAPPSAAVLAQWFEPHAAAFVFDGDAARFMQDFTLTVGEGAECGIDALLIEAAGGSTIDQNIDHFVKRGTIKVMCPHCAAIALFTLQTNAPSGGAGHRTGLRGGGPLTTLLVATAAPGMPPSSLWETLWLNVKPNRTFLRQGGDVEKIAPHFTFPWLQDIQKIQAPEGETQPMHVHPSHVFWAMPRRIRLDFSGVRSGRCDICKRESAQLVERYSTKPWGLNYEGVWRHPLSPYYESKEGWLPVHPQPGGFSYRHWLGWVLNSSQSKKNVQAATMVNYAIEAQRQESGQLRLWVFGFDMNKAKARCWYETTFPLYDLPTADRGSLKNIQAIVKGLIEAAELGVFYLRQAVKQAWFGDSDVRGDLSFVDKSFWDATEPGFYEQLRELIGRARSERGIDMDDEFLVGLGEAWLALLHSKARKLFDTDIVGAGALSQQNPRRIAEAYNGMRRNFYGDAIRVVLHLPVAEKSGKRGKKNQAA